MGISDLFIPREEKFFELLKQQSGHLVLSARKFGDLIENYGKLAPEERGGRVKELKELEEAGDRMVHNLITALHRTFITPIDREDIHRLACELDDVLDFINGTSVRLLLFRIERLTPHARDMAALIVKAAVQMDMAVAKLSGNSNNVHEHIAEIHMLEHASDTVFHRALLDLFDGTDDAKEIIKLREIYDFLKAVMNEAEGVSDTIEAIVVKHG
ncbi:MAG: DUF47 family protein [Candidatus Aenigmarchaeota archaeon]|nr:DUF47 family protein [Candidatus Aenigmarchaeota archaeon]